MVDGFYYKYIYLLLVTIMTLSMVEHRKSLKKSEGFVGSSLLCSIIYIIIWEAYFQM